MVPQRNTRYEHDGCIVGMEYGVVEEADMSHAHVVHLKEKHPGDEASIILASWEIIFPVTSIEVSNRYDVMKTGTEVGDYENSIEYDIDGDLKEEVLGDMSKHTLNLGRFQMVSEGWRCGSYYSSTHKTHRPKIGMSI